MAFKGVTFNNLQAAQEELQSLGVDSVNKPKGYILPHPYLQKWAVVCSTPAAEELTSDWFFNIWREPPPVFEGYAILIPEKFQWCFPITIGSFLIPLIEDADGNKVVLAKYLKWQPFLDAFDRPENANYRSALLPIWEYANTTKPIAYKPKEIKFP